MSRKKKSELRVFKLRSGEEIIAKVEGKTRDKIKLHRPMRIVNNIQTDPYTGIKRHTIYFADWLGSASELTATIPLDFVVVDLSPDPDMVDLYSRQTEVLDYSSQQPQPTPMLPPLPMSEEGLQKLNNDIDKKLEEMLRQYAAEEQSIMGTSGGSPIDAPSLGFPSSMIPPPRPQNSIMFSVSIPQDILQSWVESGFIDYLKDSVSDFISTEFMEEMMNDDEDDEDEEVKDKPKKSKRPRREKISKDEWKEPTEEKKEKPTYGNSQDDWSPYLKDYLDPPPPPKTEEEG